MKGGQTPVWGFRCEAGRYGRGDPSGRLVRAGLASAAKPLEQQIERPLLHGA